MSAITLAAVRLSMVTGPRARNNMRLLQWIGGSVGITYKFNLILVTVLGAGFTLIAFTMHRMLYDNAYHEVLGQAGLMMDSAMAVRGYTFDEIRPLDGLPVGIGVKIALVCAVIVARLQVDQHIADLVKVQGKASRLAVLASQRGDQDNIARVAIRLSHLPIAVAEREPAMQKYQARPLLAVGGIRSHKRRQRQAA